MNAVKRNPRLTDERSSFKPFAHPKCYDLWLKHEQVHWLHNVVPMQQDVYDFKKRISPGQRDFLTQILRLFTQGDVDVAAGYVNNYLPVFPQPEVRMMLLGFAAREAVHIAAYSHLLETLGFPDTTYNEFMQYKEMSDKHDFVSTIADSGDRNKVIQQMTAISAFTEGMQLFSSFVMLLNFGRNNMMPGMTKIVTWSIIDESCLVAGSEVLTTNGWKNIEDVTLSDIVLQYDMETRNVSFVRPTALIHKKVDEVYSFESGDFKQTVSGDHRMIIDVGGRVDEVKAKDVDTFADDFSYILSGNKTGSIKRLTEKHKELKELSKNGEIDLADWILPIIGDIDSSWAREFLENW
jgi:hypothetical protein